MANYVKNLIILHNISEERLTEFKKKYFDEYDEFDFQKVTKMPKQLMETEESSKTPKEVYEQNVLKYGYRSWYDWAVDNWGTKWNAMESNSFYDIDSKRLFIAFETAWNAPRPIIEKIIKLNKDLTIELTYADECMGFNTGYIKGENGKVIEDTRYEGGSKIAYETYIELWDDEQLVYNEEKDNYELREEW